MEGAAALASVYLLDPEPGETPLHHALDVPALLARAARRSPRHYHRYWERSHLVGWGRGPALGTVLPRARLALARGRLALA